MNEKKSNNIGAIWEKESRNGAAMLSIRVELEGKSYNFTAMRNKFKEGIEARPDWNILPMREMNAQNQTQQSKSKSDDTPF